MRARGEPGWVAAMVGECTMEVRKTGRGERRHTARTDLNVPVRLPLEIALTGMERGIVGAIG
jgi:hypothetical protein